MWRSCRGRRGYSRQEAPAATASAISDARGIAKRFSLPMPPPLHGLVLAFVKGTAKWSTSGIGNRAGFLHPPFGGLTYPPIGVLPGLRPLTEQESFASMLPRTVQAAQERAVSQPSPVPPERPSLRVFEGAVAIPTLGLVVYGIVRSSGSARLSLVPWMLLIAVVDLLPVSTWRGIQMLLDFPLLVAVAMLYRPEAACAALFIASFDAREFKREVGVLRAGFNRSQVALSAFAASATFHALGDVHGGFLRLALAGLPAIAAGYLVNTGLVAIGASLLYREPLPAVVARLRIGRPLEFLVGHLGLGIVGIAAAELYLEVGFWAVAFVIVPLALARQSFFRSLALERARQELAAAYEAERRRVAELERLDRAKAELAQVLTHDFLHAIATLRTYVAALRKRWEQIEEAERFEVAGWIERESDRLKALAEQSVAIMFGDAEGPSLSLRRERVADLVEEAADATTWLGGRLTIDMPREAGPVVVWADRVRVLQVFRNLLSNAAFYSEPGTPVELAVRAGDGEVRFAVRDRGPGIAPQDVGRLFRPFSRLPRAVAEETPGSGLGLYVSRRIVEALRGRIEVESEPGVGSTFSFTLPREEG
jgi:signal transduction histidine kinase